MNRSDSKKILGRLGSVAIVAVVTTVALFFAWAVAYEDECGPGECRTAEVLWMGVKVAGSLALGTSVLALVLVIVLALRRR